MIAQPQTTDAELDGGPHARDPDRLCVATRTVRPVSDLIRFVVGPGGEVVPDVRRRLPGRGMWVTATRAALEEAVRRKAFARGFGRQVRFADDLGTVTERLLERSALDALAMAAKSGLVASGFARTAGALQQGDVVALLHAAGCSGDGVRKLNAAWRRQEPARLEAGPGAVPGVVIEILSSAQLDLATGRPNVVHAALLAGPASGTFLSRWRRLERFRTGEAGDRVNQAGELHRIEPAGIMDRYD